MTNNSGKFASSTSNYVGEAGNLKDVSMKIPQAPAASGSAITQFIEEYFGKYWWVWLIVVLIILKK